MACICQLVKYLSYLCVLKRKCCIILFLFLLTLHYSVSLSNSHICNPCTEPNLQIVLCTGRGWHTHSTCRLYINRLLYNSCSPNNNERKGDGVRNRAKNRLEGHLGYRQHSPTTFGFCQFFLATQGWAKPFCGSLLPLNP